jgi:hypothetical protein
MTAKKTGGRPRTKGASIFTLRATPEELDAWAELAADDGRSLSGWLRSLANRAVSRARRG